MTERGRGQDASGVDQCCVCVSGVQEGLQQQRLHLNREQNDQHRHHQENSRGESDLLTTDVYDQEDTKESFFLPLFNN